MSAPAKPEPVVHILESLVIHMIDQFFSMMTYCTELVAFGRTLLSSCGHYSKIMSRASDKSGF